MKKSLLTSLLSLAAVGAFAQGTVVFNNHVVGTIATHVWSPQLDGSVETGNTASDTPAGTAVYTGQLIGGAATGATSPTDYSNGTLWTAQLYALTGLNDSLSSLQPVSQYVTTFHTTAAGAGIMTAVSPAGDAGIPNTAGAQATVALAVWYNGGGTITSLSAAKAAGVPYGESPAFNLSSLGEPAQAGPPVVNATSSENLIGLQSFSLTTTPEPSTIALGVMGLSAFLIRRRK
jgi:hypothetical protein